MEEAEKVKRAAESDRGQEAEEEGVAVSVRGLVKTYPGRVEMKGCCCKSLPPFHAIKVSALREEEEDGGGRGGRGFLPEEGGGCGGRGRWSMD